MPDDDLWTAAIRHPFLDGVRDGQAVLAGGVVWALVSGVLRPEAAFRDMAHP